jgi:hypothetical protein
LGLNTLTWNSEAEFVDLLEAGVPTSPPQSGLAARIWREFPTGTGSVDLLAVWYDARILANRCYSRGLTAPGEFRLVHGYAMACLQPRRWVQKAELRAFLRLCPKHAAQVLALLDSRGLIEASADRVRTRPLAEVSAVRAIDAYEAKLTKWREVAEQAFRHRWFASRTFVAMPRPGDTVRERLREACSRWEIGLWLRDDAAGWSVTHATAGYRVPSTQIGWWVNELLFEEYCRGSGRTAHRRCA